MYTRINIVSRLEPEAEKFILDNDRMLYLPFFTRAEEFCIENSVLIGGRVGIDLLVGREITKDSFMWDLYCDDTFNTTKTLADELSRVVSPHIPARTVSLMTNIRHKEFTLSINARVLFKIYSMDKYRGIKLVDLMGPATRTSYFTHAPIKLVSEEMQLIEIYRNLYTPKKLHMWESELAAEDKIYSLISDTLGEKAVKELSGGIEKFNKTAAEEIILRKIVAGSDNVLIGDYALEALGLSSASRLQFISSMRVDDIAAAVEMVLKNDIRRIKVRVARVTFVKYPLNIPSDFQIAKYTLYVNNGREQTPIADVFNSSTFEMIPYWLLGGEYSRVKVGNPWVLLRFMLIDIWVLKLILNIGTDSPEFIKGRVGNIIKNADKVRKVTREKINSDASELFQLNGYVGCYIDENVAKKKLIKEIGERFPAYYPAKSVPAIGEAAPPM